MSAPVASGWSGCRVGLAPTGKRRLCTAHTHRSRRRFSQRTTGLPHIAVIQFSSVSGSRMGPDFPGDRRKLTLTGRAIAPKDSSLASLRIHTPGYQLTAAAGGFVASHPPPSRRRRPQDSHQEAATRRYIRVRARVPLKALAADRADLEVVLIPYTNPKTASTRSESAASTRLCCVLVRRCACRRARPRWCSTSSKAALHRGCALPTGIAQPHTPT